MDDSRIIALSGNMQTVDLVGGQQLDVCPVGQQYFDDVQIPTVAGEMKS